MAAATGALWAAGPLRSRASAAIESVQTTTGRESARVSALDSSSSAALRAKSSALGADLSGVAAWERDGGFSSSVHDPTGGRAVRPNPGGLRRKLHQPVLCRPPPDVGGRSRRPSGPTSRLKVTPSGAYHAWDGDTESLFKVDMAASSWATATSTLKSDFTSTLGMLDGHDFAAPRWLAGRRRSRW